jgi:murein DD-endopeptidase MepM/ murein hydrolase activator NlpD
MEEKIGFYPVLGTKMPLESYGAIDLSVTNSELEDFNVDSREGMADYLEHFKRKENKKVPYGGYGEKRFIYMKSPLFKESKRCIHLGIDLWMPSDTPLYAGMEAMVHSFDYNNNYLDYGATIILEYQLNSSTFYALYGHLSLASLAGLKPGKTIQKGENFAWVGSYAENGSWEPHLHLQSIVNIGENKGDYPGVVSEKESEFYLNNCPSPEILIFP